MKYSKDIFYLLALALVVVGGCATPLGLFNKQQKKVDYQKLNSPRPTPNGKRG
jgi:hypothetical protein